MNRLEFDTTATQGPFRISTCRNFSAIARTFTCVRHEFQGQATCDSYVLSMVVNSITTTHLYNMSYMAYMLCSMKLCRWLVIEGWRLTLPAGSCYPGRGLLLPSSKPAHHLSQRAWPRLGTTEMLTATKKHQRSSRQNGKQGKIKVKSR